MKRISTITAIVIAIVIAVVTSQTGVAQSSGGGRLAGTWETTVTIRNCATGNAIVSFQSVGSFNQGGTFSGISSGNAPSTRSSEAGVWSHTKGENYRFRFKAYLFNAAGVATGYQVITHNLALDSEAASWTSEGINEVFSMNGALMSTGCSSAESTRMVLE